VLEEAPERPAVGNLLAAGDLRLPYRPLRVRATLPAQSKVRLAGLCKLVYSVLKKPLRFCMLSEVVLCTYVWLIMVTRHTLGIRLLRQRASRSTDFAVGHLTPRGRCPRTPFP
jgi:hypothetical protein